MEDRHFEAFAGIAGLDDRLRAHDDLARNEDAELVCDSKVTLLLSELELIAERILELSEIARQNALTAESAQVQQEAMADSWTPPPQPERGMVKPSREQQLANARERAAAKPKGGPLD